MAPWQFKDIRWTMGGYIAFVHVLALAGICYIPSCKAATLAWAAILWPICGFGITGGAHRLWSHRSYSAGPAFRCVTMIVNSIANQGTIWHWSRDHRTHHFHSETVADPHDAIRGFWFAHIGWLFLKKDPRVAEAGNKVNMDDLRADGFVMFQKKYDPWWNFFWCFVFPGMVASYGWGETAWNGFFVPGALRYVWVLHMTWFVAIAAIGEGWHNWHHKYPFDYAASELGVLRQYNPTKLIIDVCASVGLVSERKRATAMWNREKAKMAKAS